ncbi:MAG: sortase [Clostridia bacterium]|nr:sortase [Clostridia bacterium]
MEKAGKKKIKIGITLMAFGLLLITAAGDLFAYNRINDKKAGETAHKIIESVEKKSSGSSDEVLKNGEKIAVIDGTKYSGIISIPALYIELPVQTDYSLAKLKNAPCVYSGSVIDGTAVICAHNYQSHFGNLKYAAPGVKVYFTDVEGLTYQYEIAKIETLDGYDVEKMKESTGWDMTLFTCTYSGRQRVTARLKRVMSDDMS